MNKTITVHVWDPTTGTEFMEVRDFDSVIRNPGGCKVEDIGLELLNSERRKLGLSEYKHNPETGTFDETERQYPLATEFVQFHTDKFVTSMEEKSFSVPEMDDNLIRAKAAFYDSRDKGRITQEDFVKSMNKLVPLIFRLKRDGKTTI